MKRNRFYSLAYVVLWPVIHVLFRPVVTGKERIPDGNARVLLPIIPATGIRWSS